MILGYVALGIVLAVAAAGLLGRMLAAPSGAHRATVPMRPQDAEVNDLAYCPAEERDTLHAFLATGGRVCWTCRTVTTEPTPPGGAE